MSVRETFLPSTATRGTFVLFDASDSSQSCCDSLRLVIQNCWKPARDSVFYGQPCTPGDRVAHAGSCCRTRHSLRRSKHDPTSDQRPPQPKVCPRSLSEFLDGGRYLNCPILAVFCPAACSSDSRTLGRQDASVASTSHTSRFSLVPAVGPSSLTFAGSNLQEVVTTDSTNAGCADDLPRVVIVISVCCDGDFSDIDRSGACSLSVVVSVGTGTGLRRALCGQTTQSLRGSWEASQQIGGFLVAGSNRCSW